MGAIVSANAQFRTVRAGVFATACVGVSAGGHAAMSDHALPWAGPLIGFALVFACARAAAGRERGLGAISAWMLWGQLALHLLFSYLQSTHTGPAQHGTAAPDAAAAADQASGPGMFAAHVLAALVSAWWLRRGEAALFTLLRLIAALLLTFLLVPQCRPVHRSPRPLRRRPDRNGGRRASRYLRHTVVLRGPPLLLAA
ncbi:hypothetical protein CLV63_10272 [Murinocardiopsis flavida]|uniref:Integral membrane protein n=1 Tax=Murinocardiopsis flavida TaxID=645275 RepID=A0A2P8DRV5_9ACTN|nr:hypothetical protein [Murinocardiopsis flavida]PSK99945.1 hypothetical protein CLV63_10272 [Murinocardiopsis flavida]